MELGEAPDGPKVWPGLRSDAQAMLESWISDISDWIRAFETVDFFLMLRGRVLGDGGSMSRRSALHLVLGWPEAC